MKNPTAFILPASPLLMAFSFSTLSILAPMLHAQSIGYAIVDRGSFGVLGDRPFVADMNNHGDVVGHVLDSTTLIRKSYLSDASGFTDLGHLEESLSMSAQAINDSRQIVGYGGATNRFNQGTTAAFVYEGGVLKNLNRVYYTYGMGINNHGDIAGYGGFGPSPTQGVIIPASDRTMYQNIVGEGGLSISLFAINDSGDAVGRSGSQAMLFTDGVQIPLGTMEGSLSSAIRLNNSGLILGNSRTTGDVVTWRAFLHEEGTMMDLGTLGGVNTTARDLNENGFVVGQSQTADGDSHSFFYSPNTGMVDLDLLLGIDPDTALGYRDFSAFAINDLNQIAGLAEFYDGVTVEDRLLVLTPIPEPGSYALVAGIAVLTGCLIRRQKKYARIAQVSDDRGVVQKG